MSNNEYNNLASNMANLTLASQIPNLKSLIPLEEQILAKCANTDVDLLSGKVSNKTIDVCVKLIIFDKFFESLKGQKFPRKYVNLNTAIESVEFRNNFRDELKLQSLPQVISRERTLVLASEFIFEKGKMEKSLVSVFSRKQVPTYTLDVKDIILSNILHKVTLVDNKDFKNTLITAINFFLSPPTREEVQELMNETELEVIRNESEKLRQQREFNALLRRLSALKGPTFEQRLAELKRGLSRGGPGGKTKRKGRNSKKRKGRKTKSHGNKTRSHGNKTKSHGNKTRRKRSRRAGKL